MLSRGRGRSRGGGKRKGPRPGGGSGPHSTTSSSSAGCAGAAGASMELEQQWLPGQQNRSVTRRSARIARELYSAWAGRMGATTCIPAEKVQQLFNDMQLYPSRAEVLEMLRCAQQCAQRPTATYLTFGEFCVFATELKRCYEKGISRPLELSRLLDRENEDKKRRTRKLSKGLPKCEVFLGGSCNPTTWRQDVAVPLLKSLGITFYNPQVSCWAPELVEKEHNAKQNASVLLFVIDSGTRNTATSVEVPYLSAARKNVILVIHPYQSVSCGCKIAGEIVSDEELRDLTVGQEVMQSLAERQGVPIFHSIHHAINCSAKVLRENIPIHEIGMKDSPQSGKIGQAHLSDKLMKLREAFDAVDSNETGEISLGEVCLAFRILNNRDLSLSDLRSVASGYAGVFEKETKENIPFENLRVNFDQFCAIVAEFKSKNETWGVAPPAVLSQTNCFRDVYLGGTSEGTTWREDLAIPLLKKHGLTYFSSVPTQCTKRLLPITITDMDNSRVILFVITDTSRSLAELALAAYYIGLGRDVVLYVQLFTEDSIVNGKKLSKEAVKDYNRGRVYLKDCAAKDGVSVFNTVSDAVECALSKRISPFRKNSASDRPDSMH